MKRWLANILGLAALSVAMVSDDYRYIANNSFQAGEHYDYRVKFGFMNIGLASVSVNSKIYQMNQRPCYRISVFGRTTGMTDLFRIRNNYVSYVDTLAIFPHQFSYSAREGDFKRDQTVFFYQSRHKAVQVENKESKTFSVPQYCQDLVSGYYYLRTLPFERMRSGEIIETPVFFASELYNMKVKFKGRTQISTDLGKINVFEMSPILPDNNMFDGPEAIKVYISDDKNRVPIEIYVDFKIGNCSMELKSYRNQRYPFNWK